jgi:hypothetical protein
VIQVWTRVQYGKDRILCRATTVNLPAIVAEQEGMAQYKFPYPVKGRAQGQSRGPPIPVVRVDVLAVSIVAIHVIQSSSLRSPPLPLPLPRDNIVACHPQLAVQHQERAWLSPTLQ